MSFEERNAEAYGSEAADLLWTIEEPIAKMARDFAASFYGILSNSQKAAKVMAWLTPEQFAQLEKKQADHLAMLLGPTLTRERHWEEAQRAGTAHALTGVDILWLIETYSLYQSRVHRLMDQLEARAERREPLMWIASQRILLDLEGQAASYERIEQQLSRVTLEIDQLALSAGNFADLVRGSMEAIASLEGKLSLLFSRADSTGCLQVEASYGAAAERYHQWMEDGRVPKISIDANLPQGQGVGGLAWRSGRVAISDAWQLDDRTSPWHESGTELGFRSAAAVPMLDEAGKTAALLSIYGAWPGYFSALRMKNFLAHVQHVLGYAMQRIRHAAVIPLRERQEYRQLLQEGRLTMLYQPILDLRDGRLCRLEALARLRGEDDTLIVPGRFLPAFGESELLELFRLGLKEIGRALREFEGMNLRVPFSLNFPAQALGDERYEKLLTAALEDGKIRAGQLQLELLETAESGGPSERGQLFLQRLRDRGIGFAQDDLGSGHSSLLRMGQYNFDEVKIDQGMIRSAIEKPQRALEFILYLTRLAHAFRIRVTVEGLETAGMIEAAAILGADFGQGYGIAYPMPLQDVSLWQARHRYRVDASRPMTALGAMAGYLLWDSQQAGKSAREELARTLPGARGMVEAFLRANALHESPLGLLLQELSATDLATSDGDATKLRVISYLTEYWLTETRQ